MKNLSLILNIILLIAVAVLFYLHFAGKSPSTASGSSAALTDIKIAYITSDSVLKHYAFLDLNRKILEDKTKKLGQELQNRAQGLQNEIANYQRSANNLTLSQAKALEEDLGKKQQNLQMYQQSLEQQMAGEEAKLNKELYERITNFLKKYAKEKGLQVVFKYDVSSDVLYGGEGLDITSDVLQGLNDAYKEENSTGTKSDSTSAK